MAESQHQLEWETDLSLIAMRIIILQHLKLSQFLHPRVVNKDLIDLLCFKLGGWVCQTPISFIFFSTKNMRTKAGLKSVDLVMGYLDSLVCFKDAFFVIKILGMSNLNFLTLYKE